MIPQEPHLPLQEDDEPRERKATEVCDVILFPVACSCAMDGTGNELWEASVYLSKNLNSAECDTIIELGAGLGLAGLVAERRMKASEVLLTDCDREVLRNLDETVAANKSRAKVVKMEWGRDFPVLRGKSIVFLAADCVYTPSLGRSLADTIMHYAFCEKKCCRVYLSQRCDRPGFQDTFLSIVSPYVLVDRRDGDFIFVELLLAPNNL